MKTIINAILAVCAIALAWICVGSIIDDQAIDEQIEARQKVVEKRLIDIRKAQEAYKEQHDTVITYIDEEAEETKEARMGCYAETFDELIAFLKTAKYPEQISKEGQIQEGAQRKGWNDKKVADHIYNLRREGKSDDAIREILKGEELPGVWIDTVWAENPIKAIFGREDYPVDSLRYIPCADALDGQFKEFELAAQVHFKMKIPMNYIMECAAPFATFMKGLGNAGKNKQINMKKYEEERGAYPGLKIGDMVNWNNNAGNWE